MTRDCGWLIEATAHMANQRSKSGRVPVPYLSGKREGFHHSGSSECQLTDPLALRGSMILASSRPSAYDTGFGISILGRPTRFLYVGAKIGGGLSVGRQPKDANIVGKASNTHLPVDTRP